MPGEQADLGGYSQQERDDCVSLQEAFRKGELICIGMGVGNRGKRLENARHRVLNQQPLVPVFSDESESSFSPNPVEYETLEPEMEDFHPQNIRSNPVEIVDKFEGMMTMDESGVMAIHNLPDPFKRAAPEPANPVLPEQPTITPERIREIMNQRCISFRNNGKKCKRWSVTGYEYCIDHMPEKMREEYKAKKKQNFFKQ